MRRRHPSVRWVLITIASALLTAAVLRADPGPRVETGFSPPMLILKGAVSPLTK